MTKKPTESDVRRLELHHYVPSAIHQGDCAVCGHVQAAPYHIKVAPIDDLQDWLAAAGGYSKINWEQFDLARRVTQAKRREGLAPVADNNKRR